MNKLLGSVAVVGVVALASVVFGKWTVKKTPTTISVRWVASNNK